MIVPRRDQRKTLSLLMDLHTGGEG
jgi:hypothetical protein